MKIGSKIGAILAVSLGVGFTAVVGFVQMRQEASLEEQNRASLSMLASGIQHSLQTIMLAGYADIAESVAKNLKLVPGIVDFRIMRTNGLEAFRDNKTINFVNAHRGEFDFFPREQETENRIIATDDENLTEIVRTKEPKFFYMTDDANERFLTYLAPIENRKKCIACHSADHEIRGVIKLTASMANVEGQIWSGRLQAFLIAVTAIICVLIIGSLAIHQTVISPIGKLTTIMSRLAGGDRGVEVPFADRRDELGDIANAVKIFKTNAIEKARVEAQAEEAREEFEADRKAQESIIETSVGEVVSAAIAGELSARIDTSNLSGVLERVSQGVNTLLENVDRGLSETVGIMSALANGDLTQRMTGDYQGRFLRLKEDANAMGEQIRSIAGRITGVSVAVRTATQEIATGVSDLSSRTEHQASSLEETTASMEELSVTVRQNAENAQEAKQVAVAARDAATGGGEVAGEAVEAMSEIEESSRKITDIVGLIQEIAFQTNLLALNAAVEAARAGDAGKGFAVVASEVRALAQRSSQASKDIKVLILKSDDQVRNGVELVNKAGGSLEEIVTSVRKVTDFVSEIAAASQEQALGIEQVSNSITNLDEITQQNAALVEETTAALHSAQFQVNDLRQAVALFRTGDEEADPDFDSSPSVDEENPVHQQRKNRPKWSVPRRATQL